MSVIEALSILYISNRDFPIRIKLYLSTIPIPIIPGMNRTEICETLSQLRDQNPVADLAFYASRDLSKTDWRPFITAALERNPVILEATQTLTIDQLIETLKVLPNESIYDATRVAQPDEVWNYQRGDGLECALTLATCLRARDPSIALSHREHLI